MTDNDIRAHLDALAKPRGSLGRLEELAVRLALTQGRLDPVTRPRRLVLFAGDHGCVADGVSAWPSAVTGMMVATILASRATSNALAAAHDCRLRLVDVGVSGDRPADPPGFFRDARVADGTASLAGGPAMSVAQFDAAWAVGADEAARALAAPPRGGGARLLIAGEMGIGNTTPAACLTALIAGIAPEAAVGRGAGADDSVMAAKRTVVAAAVARARAEPDPRAAVAGVCGFEIAAMAGFYAAGAAGGASLLLDGYVATAAALIADALAPGSARAMIAAHRSAEPGHAAALAHLGLEPLLDWGMRLGEGSGALVALPLLDSAAALLTDVARLDAIGAVRED